MNLGNWALANPAGLWWALLALPIIALHILKPRRVRQTVAAIFLWKEVATPVTAARPWQRLIPSWLLFAQVLAALALALALAEPVRLTPLALAEHTIFVVDGSASMQTSDGTPSRLDAAAERASELRRQVPTGGEASLIFASDNARALLTRSSDVGDFDRALEGLEPYDGVGDFDNAFALAAGLNTGDRPTRVVFVSDGGVSPDSLRFAPAGTRYERVGETATNRSISRFSVEPTSEGLVARVAVRNHGGPVATQTLRIDVDGVTVDRQPVELDTGQIENLSVRLPPGERIEAFLETDDGLALDNRAVATVARRPELSVLQLGPANAFLDAALDAIDGVTVDRLDPEALADLDPADLDLAAVDVVIVDRVEVPDELLAANGAPIVAIAPPGGVGPISVTGEIERPILTLVSNESPLATGLDFSDVLLARAQDVEVVGNQIGSETDPTSAPVAQTVETILAANRSPLLLHARRAGADIVYFTFALDESTLPLQAAFPVLIDRMLTDLAQSALPPARLPVGARLPLDPRVEATVTGPDGTSSAIAPGSTAPVANRMGFWSIEQPDRVPVLVAVNPEAAESAIAPQPDLPFPRGFGESSDPAFRGEIPLWRYVVAFLLIVLVAEWLLARRRIGVGRRQWNVSQGLRAAVALALLAALFNLNINIPSTKVATIFLVDSSDSKGAPGRAEASQFVVDALIDKEDRDDDNLAGVVAFGRNARLENLASENPVFSGISVDLDAAGTDLSAALRLGAAALPGDARQRLVVISDGRSTHGDLLAEAERLAETGVPVDVVLVEPPSGADAALASVEAPSVARVGEEVVVTATVEAEAAGDAVITLRRNGEIVSSQAVALAPGENSVSFTDTAADTGVLRYQVDVDAAGDPVSDNNRGFAAVPVSGAERVLLVDGEPSAPDGDNLAAALAASGLNVDTVTIGGIPPLDELSQVASIVLVNVDRFDLSDSQVSVLTAAVRDLGRGLVTVGGDQSYALGGYRGSDLEELLPVESEITDPLRRQTVAQVLAIDTSGSMDACHCDEEGNNGLGGGNRVDGGVIKTVIAQQAAAKAIAALSATDEVGVLTMDNSDQWVIDLQANPSQDVIDDGLSRVNPAGPTILRSGLETAAIELRKSNAALKHVIFFSDGFTDRADLNGLVDQAAALAAEGITVSVVATGEGAAGDLEPVAEAGGGRFYPGRNLEQIPDIIVQETVTASRSFVTEGQFVPTVTSSADSVSGLTETPILDGYIATTPKSLARVDLRVGPDNDPLLASWRTGLGRVTSWTSDGGERWSQRWSGWNGAPSFWSGVVKETFPTTSDGGGVQVTIDGDQMTVKVEGVDAWPDDATASVRVNRPAETDGGGDRADGQQVTLERVDGTTFAATVPVDEAGVYAVGASVEANGEALWTGVGLSTRSYPAEYAPRPVDPAPLEALAATTGGRVQPAFTDVFDSAGTRPGDQRLDWTTWLLWFAVLAWPIAVAVSRLSWRQGLLADTGNKASSTIRSIQRTFPTMGDVPARRPEARTSPPDRSEVDNSPGTTATDLGAAPPPTAPPTAPPSSSASSPDRAASGQGSGSNPAGSDTPEHQGGDETSLERMLEAKRRRKNS